MFRDELKKEGGDGDAGYIIAMEHGRLEVIGGLLRTGLSVVT